MSPTTNSYSTDEDWYSDRLESYNPSNRLLNREFIEGVLSRLCGYGIRIGSLEPYQLAFVHKSVYRKDISPPIPVVEQYLKRTKQKHVPSHPEPPVGTFRPAPDCLERAAHSKSLIFTDTYEAMEFAGDGWINCIIGQYVKSRFPRQSEGFYTKLKQHVVSKTGLDGMHGLSKIGAYLGFGEYALLSPRAEEIMTRQNPSLLEDIFEAFCCAVMEDLGVGVLRVVVKNVIEATIDFRSAIINDTNYKDVLKRLCKENGWSNPGYVDLGDNGKSGAKREYSVGVLMIPGVANVGVKSRSGFDTKAQLRDLWATGSATTKKKAQQNAAYNALKCLEVALQYARAEESS
jgi:dsRNA-specific ribonuclease